MTLSISTCVNCCSCFNYSIRRGMKRESKPYANNNWWVMNYAFSIALTRFFTDVIVWSDAKRQLTFIELFTKYCYKLSSTHAQ